MYLFSREAMEFINGIKASTSKGTTGCVLALLKKRKPGKVLDAPAGEGALSRLLLDTPHDVTAMDIDGDAFSVSGVKLVTGNMNEALPFPDASFDYLACVDGIEHFENPYFTIREFNRVLAPGGEVFISTPNISAFRSRLRYLFTGMHNKGKMPLEEARPSPFHHINLMTFPELRYGLHRHGFQLTDVAANRVKPAAWPSLLLYPFVALGTSLAWRHEKAEDQRALNREIYRQMLSWPVAMGETLVLGARKVN